MEKRNEMSTHAGTAAVAETQRVNLNLATKAYEDLQQLCKQTQRTMTEIIRFGLALAKLYFDERRKGNSLMITTSDGTAIREIVFPD
jgi:hypothetical protein